MPANEPSRFSSTALSISSPYSEVRDSCVVPLHSVSVTDPEVNLRVPHRVNIKRQDALQLNHERVSVDRLDT